MAQLKDNTPQEFLTEDGNISLTSTVLELSNATIIANNTYAQVEYFVKKSEEAANNGARALTKKTISIPVVNLIPNILDATAIQESLENLSVINEHWHTTDRNGNEIDLTLRKTRIFIKHSQVAELLLNGQAELVNTVLNNLLPVVENHIGVWIYFEYIDEDQENKPVETLLTSLGISIQRLP